MGLFDMENEKDGEEQNWFDQLTPAESGAVIHPDKTEQWARKEITLLSVAGISVYVLFFLFPQFPMIIALAAAVSLFATVYVLSTAQSNVPTGKKKTRLYLIATTHMAGLGLVVFWCLSSMLASYLNTL